MFQIGKDVLSTVVMVGEFRHLWYTGLIRTITRTKLPMHSTTHISLQNYGVYRYNYFEILLHSDLNYFTDANSRLIPSQQITSINTFRR